MALGVQTSFPFGEPPSPPLTSKPARPVRLAAEARVRRLEQRLQRRLAEPVRLSLTDNVRTMVSARHRPGERCVRLHHMFLDADPRTVEVLATYLKGSDRTAASTLGRFIEANRCRIRAGQQQPRRVLGAVHDLGAIYRRVNRVYFAGAVDVAITWGRQRRMKQRRKSIRLGSYSADQRLIRIHPALDRRWVPEYFLEYIVFHEMLHHVTPMPRQGGRRRCHSLEFQVRERRFAHYQRALAWERQHLQRLLRS